MNNTLVKISISGLPTIYPDFSFVDKMFVLNRVIRTGFHSEIVVTDDLWKTISDPNFKERTVQTVLYDKYQVRVYANEYLNVELLKYAKRVNILTQDRVSHLCSVLNVDYNKEDGTELGMFSIEYFDVNPDNYRDQRFPINNFLESDFLQTEYEQFQLVGLTLTNSSSIDNEWDYGGINGTTYYSELLPKYGVTEQEQQTSEVNAIKVLSRSYGFRKLDARFYLNTEDKNIVAKYLSLCDQVTISTSDGTFTAIEKITPEIKEVGNDLFMLDIELKYEKLDYYPENF